MGTDSGKMWQPIPVDAAKVLAAGITPTRLCVWAMRKRREGKPDQAVRLLDAAATLTVAEASRG